MAIEIKVPDIGVDKVEVTEIFVKIGDKVEKEQSLITVEGDKASMELPSQYAGIIKEIKISIGDKVETGTLIMLLEEYSTNKEVKIPDLGYEDEVEVTEVLVKVGDTVEAEQSLITVEGDKASMEVPAPFAGIVKELNVNIGDKVSTGSLIMVFEEDSSATAYYSKEDIYYNNIKENNIHATPIIRRLAREFGINILNVTGTGRKGRILREDIYKYIKNAVKSIVEEDEFLKKNNNDILATTELELKSLQKIDFSKFGDIEKLELGRIKKISGTNLHRNWVSIPHVTQFDETDITELEIFRKKQNSDADKKNIDIKLTILVFILKAVAKALEEFPLFNSSLYDNNKILIIKKYINIGVAVDTNNGLVVPVLRDVNKKGIIELSKELVNISKKARSGELTAVDMQGGCFTISNLGGIGGKYFTPIINAPEVAIIGISKSDIKQIWNGNGKYFEHRLMLPMSLSYDHRVIDGADGARFISFINNVLSDIRNLVM